MYTTPPPCSALRCQPMGTWTGTACLSSPASQSFPPFIAPLVLHSAPQRYMYQTSTSVSTMNVMFVFQSRDGGGGGRVGKMGRAAGLCFSVGLCSQVELMGRWEVGGVRQAHDRPYPLSSFMATVLNGAWTSITASWHSESSDSGRCWLKRWGSGFSVHCAFTKKSFVINVLPFVLRKLSLSQTNRVCSTYWFANVVG